MKRLLWGFAVITSLTLGCVISNTTKQDQSTADQQGYPGKWEEAVLTSDEFGWHLIVVRQNDEKWALESKTTCFWTRNYIGRSVWFKWGPVISLMMNDNGEVCEFYTKERLE